jgi:radical SAM superfamily enzyme YgiQ (UPF0313 family)
MQHHSAESRVFPVILIKPSHYDDDGYVIRWRRSVIPSNTLAAVYGLVMDCAERGVLGPDTEIVCEAIDETNAHVDVDAIVRRLHRAGGGFVGLVGVQTNQFPRAMDLARRFRAAGVTVVIGGFHVSGSLSMLPGVRPELQEAMDLGVILFAGEAEGRLDDLMRAIRDGDARPLYDYLSDLPGLEGQPVPFLPRERVSRSFGRQTSFDAGRGCPFQCSFCTIINVQGRKSRRRNADDIERIVRANHAQGIADFFITDDNLARNKDWEEIFDRLILLRERDGIAIRFTIQVDTLCHRIENFIVKAARAGCTKVFIGLESINPEALLAAGKRQNHIDEYRQMMQAWHDQGIIIFAGYIIGFPGDTPETIRRDVEIIKRELPLDILEFFILTPLPGSEDHRKLFDAGVWMDPDFNKYDLNHVTTGHATMSAEDWRRAYRTAWETYYTPEHVETLLKRARAAGMDWKQLVVMALWFSGCKDIERLHPLDAGYFRLRRRDERRPELPRENWLSFHVRFAWETAAKHARYLSLLFRYWRMARRIWSDPAMVHYRDEATTRGATEHFAERRQPARAARHPRVLAAQAAMGPETR